MSRTRAPSQSRASIVARWIGVAGACAVVALVGLDRSAPAPAPAGHGERRATGAYRPSGARGLHEPAQPRAGAAEGAEDALSPELEARLRAASHVATVPVATPSGAPPPLPPSEPLSPEGEAQRHLALTGWQQQAQQLLDECVARPTAQRRPVPLGVFFAPPPVADGLAVQQLSPVAVSMPPDELRRLWRDTDPDELQGCLDRMRMLALSVPAASTTPALVLPAAMETVLVQL